MRPLMLILFPVTILLLSGCGIKPKAVDAPSGDSAPAFPRAYPTAK